MSDRLPLTDDEREARVLLVNAAREMLTGAFPFIEGAVAVLRLRSRIGGVPDSDDDFMTFVAIASETDHLPLKAQWPFGKKPRWKVWRRSLKVFKIGRARSHLLPAAISYAASQMANMALKADWPEASPYLFNRAAASRLALR